MRAENREKWLKGRGIIRTLIAALCLPFAAACGIAAAHPAADPAEVGRRGADAWLSRDLELYDAPEAVESVHYAEVATAYGALRLAAATRDAALVERIAARHRLVIERGVENTANHVDANVYGVWPIELFRATGDPADRALGMACAAGQWSVTTPDGLTAQARYWIDDVWMIGSLQTEAWRATGDRKYLDRAALMARLYIARLQQPNGLFHHGEDSPFFWVRGNGWVAAGLAEVLSELPADHPDYPAIAAGYRKMMAALLRYQAESGMWRQLVDRPESWEESSGTGMFGFAMAVGVRRGILNGADYPAAVRRAWAALATHVQPDGKLADVCVGTGKGFSTEYYLARPRVTGDLHGQAALLWFASEMARDQPAGAGGGAPRLR